MTFTDELAQMRAAQAAVLPGTCTILRRTLEPDGAGGQSESWFNLASSVACRVGASRLQPSEKVIAERVSGKVPYIITLPAAQDVTSSDKIVVGSRTFEVVGVLATSLETARRCVCVEIVADPQVQLL